MKFEICVNTALKTAARDGCILLLQFLVDRLLNLREDDWRLILQRWVEPRLCGHRWVLYERAKDEVTSGFKAQRMPNHEVLFQPLMLNALFEDHAVVGPAAACA